MKIFLSVTASLLAVLAIVWGVCWSAHAVKERSVIREAEAKLQEIKSHDSQAQSQAEASQDAQDTGKLALAIENAARSGADPFWFVQNAGNDDRR